MPTIAAALIRRHLSTPPRGLMMAGLALAVSILCTLTSLACAGRLLRGYPLGSVEWARPSRFGFGPEAAPDSGESPAFSGAGRMSGMTYSWKSAASSSIGWSRVAGPPDLAMAGRRIPLLANLHRCRPAFLNRRLDFEHMANLRRQRVRRERFLEIVHARLEHAVPNDRVVRVSGDEQDLDGREPLRDLVRELTPAHPGEHDVGDQQIGLSGVRRNHRQRRGRIGRYEKAIAKSRQQQLDDLPDLGLIFHQ